MSLTVSEARQEAAEAAGICQTDDRVYYYINKAVRRLLPKGKWKGTYQRYHLCVNQSCFVWPRQFESIETVALCGRPGVIRNQWYDFNPYGPGILNTNNTTDQVGTGQCGTCAGNQLVDRGLAVMFSDIVGTAKQLRVYCDFPADVGKTITFRGYDDQRNIVITNSGDTEGEVVTLANPFAVTTNAGFWGIVTQVIKDITKGMVRVYEYDTVAMTQRLIALYEPDETLPSYLKSSYPGAQVPVDATSTCNKQSVDVIAKLRFIPVRKDSDFIQIENLAAICEEIRAVRKFENNLIQEGLLYEQLALKYLNEELQNYLGDGTRIAIHFDGASPFESGAILNLI
jgi:hypothetical protein